MGATRGTGSGGIAGVAVAPCGGGGEGGATGRARRFLVLVPTRSWGRSVAARWSFRASPRETSAMPAPISSSGLGRARAMPQSEPASPAPISAAPSGRRRTRAVMRSTASVEAERTRSRAMLATLPRTLSAPSTFPRTAFSVAASACRRASTSRSSVASDRSVPSGCSCGGADKRSVTTYADREGMRAVETARTVHRSDRAASRNVTARSRCCGERSVRSLSRPPVIGSCADRPERSKQHDTGCWGLKSVADRFPAAHDRRALSAPERLPKRVVADRFSWHDAERVVRRSASQVQEVEGETGDQTTSIRAAQHVLRKRDAVILA